MNTSILILAQLRDHLSASSYLFPASPARATSEAIEFTSTASFGGSADSAAAGGVPSAIVSSRGRFVFPEVKAAQGGILRCGHIAVGSVNVRELC